MRQWSEVGVEGSVRSLFGKVAHPNGVIILVIDPGTGAAQFPHRLGTLPWGRRLVRGVSGPLSPGGSVGLVRGFASILLLLADRIIPPPPPRHFREASGTPLASSMGISCTSEVDPDSAGGIDGGGDAGAGTEDAVPGCPPGPGISAHQAHPHHFCRTNHKSGNQIAKFKQKDRAYREKLD
ncbi:hypothetical protein B296_00018369 [Ensete ventricosum]|uniref:Uncharacterized protein n=1 Tax=Ensete ventricosum TaxID=4639 RepID=A0A426ZAG6_ENSVE|nr:hypothetical protein B296_00018369 [Ensete ventricosum]